jgi:hypothetical protein
VTDAIVTHQLRPGFRFTALASKPVGFTLVRRVAIIGPLLPTDVHFLGQESVLCQLQSCLGGELSIVAPTVRHDFPVLGQLGHELVEFVDRGAERAGNVPARERSPAARIQEYEVECTSFDGVQYVVPLFLGAKFRGIIVAIRANFVYRESHLPPPSGKPGILSQL